MVNNSTRKLPDSTRTGLKNFHNTNYKKNIFLKYFQILIKETNRLNAIKAEQDKKQDAEAGELRMYFFIIKNFNF